MRGTTAMPMLDTEAGLDATVALVARNPGKPVVVADVWDNPGGGVAGDGTLILRRIIERGIGNVAVATIWDPIAVTFCLAAGEGALIQLRFGGKAGPDGGAPIDARVEVLESRGGRLAEFRQEPCYARTRGGRSSARHGYRGDPQHQPDADVRAGHFLQSRHRSRGRRKSCSSSPPTISTRVSNPLRQRSSISMRVRPIHPTPRKTDYRKLVARNLAAGGNAVLKVKERVRLSHCHFRSCAWPLFDGGKDWRSSASL